MTLLKSCKSITHTRCKACK